MIRLLVWVLTIKNKSYIRFVRNRNKVYMVKIEEFTPVTNVISNLEKIRKEQLL